MSFKLIRDIVRSIRIKRRFRSTISQMLVTTLIIITAVRVLHVLFTLTVIASK